MTIIELGSIVAMASTILGIIISAVVVFWKSQLTQDIKITTNDTKVSRLIKDVECLDERVDGLVIEMGNTREGVARLQEYIRAQHEITQSKLDTIVSRLEKD